MEESKTSQRFQARKIGKGFLPSNKALSPIFATLIILAVVTVLFIPVFIWATGVASQNQESWQLSGTMARERIVIEEVNLKTGQTSCTIYVRNIGTTAVSISNIIIVQADGKNATHVYQEGNFIATPQSVVQGDLITVQINALGFSVWSTTYNIKVVTTRGISDEYQTVT